MPLRERARPIVRRSEPPKNTPHSRMTPQENFFNRIIGEIPGFMEKALEASDLIKRGPAMKEASIHTRMEALNRAFRLYEPDLRRRALNKNYRFNFRSPEWHALSQLSFELGVNPELIIEFLVPSKGGKSRKSVPQLINELRELINTYKQAKGLDPNSPFHALPREEWLNLGRQLNSSKIFPKQLAAYIMKKAMEGGEN